MSEMAKIFDFDTKRFSIIPAAELAPGLIMVNIQNDDGSMIEAWVDPSQLEIGKPQRETLGAVLNERVRAIKESLDPVYPMSIEDWTYGFLCDQNPEGEIVVWERVVRVLEEARRELGEDKKYDIFNLLVLLMSAGSASLEQIQKVRRDKLDLDDAMTVIRLFQASGA